VLAVPRKECILTAFALGQAVGIMLLALGCEGIHPDLFWRAFAFGHWNLKRQSICCSDKQGIYTSWSCVIAELVMFFHTHACCSSALQSKMLPHPAT
jgi:hypothetical protein